MKKRLFVGIPVHEKLAMELQSIAQSMQIPFWNWTLPSNYHLTACFIGHVEDTEVPIIIEKLKNVSKPSFSLEIDKIIPVKRKQKIDMIWTSFKYSQEFREFSISLHAALNIALDREPKAHITLCRIKALNTRNVAENEFPAINTKKMNVSEFCLYESVSQGKGPVYQILERF